MPRIQTRPRRMIAALALSAFLAIPAAAQEIAQNAQRQISALLAEKASRTPAQAKIDSHLLHAAMVVSGRPLDPALPPLAGEVKAVRADANNFVEVDILAGVTGDLLAAIRSAGGTIVSSFPEYESVRARLPLTRLESVAGRPEVRQIRAAEYGHVNGAIGLGRAGAAARGQAVRERLAGYLHMPAVSIAGLLPALNTSLYAGQTNAVQGVGVWGDAAMAANTVRTNFGFDGTTVRVGVISDGIDSLAAEAAAGHLPPGVTAIPGQSGSGDEGTAMLEIVYSLAPGATLYFATGYNGAAQMAANIRALAAPPYNCNVIVDDINYFSEGVFQDGVIAKAVNDVAAAGVLYFSSAGNSGNALNGTSGTWEGDFYDSGQNISAVSVKEPGAKYANVSIHSFDRGATNYNVLTTLSKADWSDGQGSHTGHYELKWSDPLGRSNNDYDLFILDKGLTQVLDSSTNTQNGTQDPEEFIDDNSKLVGPCAPAASTAPCRVVIAKYSGAAARTLHLDTERGVLAQATNGATYGHNAASGAFTVAATDARAACYTPYNYCGPFTASNIAQWDSLVSPSSIGGVEPFSSDGPRLMYYKSDGTAYTQNNFTIATGGGTTLYKPDLTAADCVRTGVSGYSTFCGTSAAAPHAAAVAALMLQARQSTGVTAANVLAAGNMLAVSGSTGWNENSGMGVLMADKFLNTLCGYSAVAPSSIPAAGGTSSLSIAANPGCVWNVTSASWPDWINMPTRSGTGPASVNFTASANGTGAPRSATLAVSGATLSITQGAQTASAPAVATTAMVSGFVGGNYSQTLTAAGGTPPYTWTKISGTLPYGLTLASNGVISGVPTTTGTFSFMVQVSDNAAATSTAQLSITIIPGATSGTLSKAGLISQIAAGSSWDSEIWIVNNTTQSVPVRIKFYGDDGTPGLKDNTWARPNTPYQVLVQGVTSSGSALPDSMDFVLNAHGTITITTNAASIFFPNGNAQGWAEIDSTGLLTGFCIFRSTGLGEGITPVQSQLGVTTLTMPFDNTLTTGVAIGNSGAPATVTVAAWDLNGNVLAPATQLMYKPGDILHQSTTWPANSHDAFTLGDRIPGTRNQRGLIQFQISSGSIVTGVGLRVGSGGTTFTSVPTALQ